MAEQKACIDTPVITDQLQGFLQYAKWIAECSYAEITELDKYIQEKTKDLVQKFQDIAKNTINHDQKSKSAEEKNEQTIIISGRKFSYSEATVELKRLTDGLVADSVLTYERTLLRKKIEEMIGALFTHAESSKDFTSKTKESVESIKKSVIDIIMAFQFQDFVKQRMQHTQMALKALTDATDQMIKDLDAAGIPPAPVPEDMAKNLLDQFLLSKVQENFIASLNEKGGAQFTVSIENDDEDDIELF